MNSTKAGAIYFLVFLFMVFVVIFISQQQSTITVNGKNMTKQSTDSNLSLVQKTCISNIVYYIYAERGLAVAYELDGSNQPKIITCKEETQNATK